MRHVFDDIALLESDVSWRRADGDVDPWISAVQSTQGRHGQLSAEAVEVESGLRELRTKLVANFALCGKKRLGGRNRS